jgi:hypothetical protein
MPGKGKGKSRGKSRGRKISERLEWQISFAIKKSLLKERSAAEIRREALEYFRDTGEELDGVKIRGKWRNPDNKNPKHRAWKFSDDGDQSLEGFFRTIRPALRKALATRHKPVRVLPGGVKVIKGKKVKP